MKMKRRLASALLAVAVCLTILPINFLASAEGGSTGKDIDGGSDGTSIGLSSEEFTVP